MPNPPHPTTGPLWSAAGEVLEVADANCVLVASVGSDPTEMFHGGCLSGKFGEFFMFFHVFLLQRTDCPKLAKWLSPFFGSSFRPVKRTGAAEKPSSATGDRLAW